MLTFDSEFYLQIQGTAMGTVFAPTYANLTLEYHKVKVYFIFFRVTPYPVNILKIPGSDF